MGECYAPCEVPPHGPQCRAIVDVQPIIGPGMKRPTSPRIANQELPAITAILNSEQNRRKAPRALPAVTAL
jgi:hypothetical protein